MFTALLLVLCALFLIMTGFVARICHDYWKKLRSQLEWKKIRRGETIRSFRLWLDCDYCRGKPSDKHCHTIVREPLPTSDDKNRMNASDPMSILMTIDREITNAMIDGARETILRRYSLVSSDVYSDILRIQYVNDPSPDSPTWTFSFGSSVGRGIVDIVFECKNRLWDTVILADTHRRTSYAQVYFVAPTGFRRVLRSYRDEEQMNRLRILYLIEDEDGYALRFEVVEHEIELVRDPLKLHAQQMRTVFFPVVGNLKIDNRDGLYGTYLLKGNTIAQRRVVSFDRKFNATFRPFDEFLRELLSRPIAPRMLAAVKDFIAMQPEGERRHAFMFKCGSDMIMGRIGDVFALRYVRPPSLLFQAAAKICRRYPNVDFPAHENDVGVDIFEEITEEERKPPMMISLNSDLLMLDD